MNPEDIEHTLQSHEDDLDRLAKDVEKLKPLRESIQDILKAFEQLDEIYGGGKISTAASDTARRKFKSLIESATKEVIAYDSQRSI